MKRETAIRNLRKAGYSGEDPQPVSGEDRRKVKRWVALLRSGKYPQGVGSLVEYDEEGKPEGYCCLGVYCAGVVKSPLSEYASGYASYPEEVHVEMPEAINRDAQEALAAFNDGSGVMGITRKKFTYIADIIEAIWLAPVPHKKKEAVPA